ncbi:MAG TPA: hypothetical protein VH593_03220 [Ktedonobacteraceae bacterium]|jgi:hypothetical protein
MTQEQQSALLLLERYRAGQIPPDEYSSMIVKWGKANLLEALPDIKPLLQSLDAHTRGEALRAFLVYFHLEEYWQTGVEFLLYDRDPYFVRGYAASTLGQFKADTRDQATLAVLASVVRDPYDYEQVRDEAYRAMLIVEHGRQAYAIWDKLSNPPEKIFDLEKDADWDFINRCYDPTRERDLHAEAEAILQAYRAGKVAVHDYYAMLLKFGRARFVAARPEVERFLSSADVLLRSTALAVLVLYFQVSNNWQMAVEVLQHDTDSEYRQAAARILGLLKRNTRDKATLHVLDQFAWDLEDQGFAFAAFEAMQKVFPGSPEEINAYLH